MRMYEVRPGYWIAEGVSWEEHQATVAGNYEPDSDETFEQIYRVESLKARVRATRRRDKARIWRTQDKQLIPYAELENRHLANIVAMLTRNGWDVVQYWPNLYAEAQRRGGTE